MHRIMDFTIYQCSRILPILPCILIYKQWHYVSVWTWFLEFDLFFVELYLWHSKTKLTSSGIIMLLQIVFLSRKMHMYTINKVRLTLMQMSICLWNVAYFLILFHTAVIFLYQTGPIKWTLSQPCVLQCWVHTHLFPVVYGLNVACGVLTHWTLEDLTEILNKYFQAKFGDWWWRYLMWKYPPMNVSGSYWW